MTKQELTDYIRDTYSVEADYPFPMDDTSCVFRHIDNRKWFALVMRIPFRTLGITKDGAVDILNIKCDPVLIGSLRGKNGFHPAYHMNKEKWLTIRLDDSAAAEEIQSLLALSYDLTANAGKKRRVGK